ncbi:MAG: HAMP domain-containing protein [Spirochaetes bacterium]|nr:HAMP domain-containing protein [Spirochaetota bacterium]
MSKKNLYTIATSLLLLILVTGISLLRKELFINPLNRSMPIKYPSYATADNDGNVFIIDQSLRRIIKSSPDKDLLISINGGKRSDGNFYNAIELCLDSNGMIYVINRVPDEDGFYTVREEVLRFHPNGSFESVIFSRIYNKNQRIPQLVQRGQLSSIHNNGNNKITWFDTAFDGVHIYNYSTTSETIDFKLLLPYRDANVQIASITQRKGKTAYITKQGRIYMHTPSDEDTVVFDGNLHIQNNFPSVPWRVAFNSQNDLIFSNILAGEIYRLDAPDYKNRKTILSQDILTKNGKPGDYYSYYNFSLGENDLLYACQDRYVVGISRSGKIEFYANSLTKPLTSQICHLLLILFFAITGMFLIIMLRLFYIHTLNRKISLILKHVGIFVPLVVAALIVTAQLVYFNMVSRFQEELLDKLSMMVQVIPLMLDAEQIKTIKTQTDFMSNEYQSVRKTMHTALNENKDSWNSSYYFALHRVVNGQIFSFMWLNDEVTTIHPFPYLNVPEGPYTQAQRGEIVTETAADAWGLWMDAIGPVYDKDGNIVALLEIGKDYVNFTQENERLFRKFMINVGIISFIFIVMFSAFSYLMLISIRKLNNGAMQISKGSLDVEIKPRGNDEVTDLTNAFNAMALSIRTKVSEIITLNQAYHRFVPEQFLTFLSKESIVDIALGDQIQKSMTILFSDIRSFTTLSEKMSPKENFNFLNNYLSSIGPVIRENEGFIDKYIGDAVMALFPNSADTAIDAAISMSRKIDEFNKQRKLEELNPIASGIGIHTGMLMLGILGEEMRIDSTVISSNVNLASRLEGLTKKFGASIIISQSTKKQLVNRNRYTLRFLGELQVKGTTEDIGIYEVLDALPEKEKIIKIETKKEFEEAISLLAECKLDDAHKLFKRLYRKNRSDLAFTFYLKLCRQFEKYPDRLALGIKLNQK